jgi:formylglycine-generating enzyme required for sulfatase activity
MAKKAPSRRTSGPKTTAKPDSSVTISGTARVRNDLVGGDKIIGDRVEGDKIVVIGSPPASEPPALPPEIAAYVAWLQKQPQGLSLIGVAGGDMPLSLDQVYVPLSLRSGLTGRPRPGKRSRESQLEECRENFELTDLFVRIDGFRHAILLGRAGTGKTTALKKLVQLCLPPTTKPPTTGPGAIHLPPGYVPLLVFLRRFTDADLERPLAAFLRDELARESRGKLRAATLDALFSREHGRLLVLLDGLDEIADPIRRTRFCEHLAQQLHEDACEHLRIVLTSRPAGHDPNAARLGKHFAAVSLEPLGPEQVPELVHRWFGEAARCLGDRYPRARATDHATRLVDALTDSQFGRDLRIMFSTPLFLTLLCVIVQQGKVMPSSRAIFYQECLHVLLERWHLGKASETTAAPRARGKLKPEPSQPAQVRLSAEVAIDVLRPIAYRLHAAGEREDEDEDELADQIRERLAALGRSEDADAVLQWLRDRAAVIVEFGEGKLGFFHLNVQEYLAALHIVYEGGDLLRKLSQEFEKTWWHETARLVVSIGGKQVFAELIGPLLDGPHIFDEALRGVLRDCFLTAREIDLQLVLDRLGGKGPQEPARSIALLGLMRGLERGRRDPRFLASARGLAERTTDAGVKAAALFAISDVQTAEPAPKAYDVAVLALDADDAAAQLLEGRLEGSGLRVWRGGRYVAMDRKQLALKVATVVLLIGSTPWPTDAGKFKMIRSTMRMIGVVASGATAPMPDGLDGVCRSGWKNEEILGLLHPQAAGSREHEAFVESVTGMRLVWVPGGLFAMGSKELDAHSLPVHPVRLNRYWIGETPVTNRQYEVFLRARPQQRKPRVWNHPDYADPEQPVVAVSWDDAMAFCAWLSEATGLKVDLPSEAQWEFAARGTENRRYPWGDTPTPDATRACFAKEKPAPVGRYQAGRGPFGTLDQAGNVWEWCKDVWDAGAYKTEAHQGAPLDPLVETGDKKYRCRRGGGFGETQAESALWLAAAFRYWGWRDLDGGNGFRVVVVAAIRPSRA